MLAIRTGIPPSQWAREGERAIATAFDVLDPPREPTADSQAEHPNKYGG